MEGDLLSADERQRLSGLRRARHEVVLGTWDLVLSQPVEEISATIDTALAPYRELSTPYLALFGLDPGDDYATWLSHRIPSSSVEVWPGHGHYPHLVDPDRFTERAKSFWAQQER